MQNIKDVQIEQARHPLRNNVPSWLLGLFENYDGVHLTNHEDETEKADLLICAEAVIDIINNDFTGYNVEVSANDLVDCYIHDSICSPLNAG